MRCHHEFVSTRVNYGETLKSYSAPSDGSDLFVVDVLGRKRDGFFVEAGALDGIWASNTLLLEEEYGWTGICVEPEPEMFAALARNRSCVCEQACLYDRHTNVEFIAGVPGLGGVRDHLADHKRHRWGEGEAVRMDTVTLASLLEKHQAPAVIDYLSLDTEGSEYIILKDFPFDRFRFRVISIEDDACNELLLGHGYRLVMNPFNSEAPWEQYFLGEDE